MKGFTIIFGIFVIVICIICFMFGKRNEDEYDESGKTIHKHKTYERKQGMISIPMFIDDIRRAMASNAQFSALSLTFMLLDECAAFEWNKSHKNVSNNRYDNEEAYVAWFDLWKESDGIVSIPYLNAKLLYKLRCSILHNTSVSLIISEPNPFLMNEGSNENTMNIDTQSLVGNLLHLIKLYYEKNKVEIDSDTMEIIDYTNDHIS